MKTNDQGFDREVKTSQIITSPSKAVKTEMSSMSNESAHISTNSYFMSKINVKKETL